MSSVTVMDLKKKELIRLKSQSSYDTTYTMASTTTTEGDNFSSDGFGSRASSSNSSSDCSTTPRSRKWRRVSFKKPNDTASSSSFAEYDDDVDDYDDEDYESDESFPDGDLDSDYDKFGKAILNGNVEAVKDSILTGIDVNHVYDREQNYSFLHLACLMGQSEIVKVLVDNGAKTDSITIDGHQAIDFIEPDDLTTISYMLNKMRMSS